MAEGFEDELQRILDSLSPEDAERVRLAMARRAAASTDPDATTDEWVSDSGWPTPADDELATLPPPDALDEATEEVALSPGSAPAQRYTVLTTLGEGGMGTVLRVRDTELNRTVAMKILRRRLLRKPSSLARFKEEAQIAAQLQHPGIIPVHDIGRRPDGSVYFTMKEVKGHTLEDVILDVHLALEEGRAQTEAGVGFRRLVDLFHRVCETVAYAHHRGVVHRDLKPENIMVGGFGEVLVLDWGLAKVLAAERVGASELPSFGSSADDDSIVTERGLDDSMKTRIGAIAGTPRWMAPEQARGQVHKIDPTTDVYALGGILYLILTGRTTYLTRDMQELLDWLQEGEPIDDPRDADVPWPVPDDLAEVALHALEHRQQDRFPTAGEMATEVRTWLDGARRREKALEVVDEARSLGPRIDALLETARRERARAGELLEGVKPGDPEADKLPAWHAEDAARRAETEAAQLGVERIQGLRNALSHDPDNPEAHAALADLFHADHRRAEADGDGPEATRLVAELRRHDRTGRYRRYLKGDGALTLVTDPPGAEVTLYRFVERNRRLVPELVEVLGETPLVQVPLEMGSFVCELKHPGHQTVTYPVFIERNQHWDGVPPPELGRGDAPFPIVLPHEGQLGPDDRYVPAGWFWCGGRDPAVTSLPWERRWCDALVVKRCHVTFGEYRDFLHALLDAGRFEEAERFQPHYDAGVSLFQRDGDGRDARFLMTVDKDGDPVKPEYPVVLVDHAGATAYAAWRAEVDGVPWRLPEEWEFEKYARGVDGRTYATGEHVDPSWTLMRNSKGSPGWAPADSHPLDRSTYGVQKTLGAVLEWCRTPRRTWFAARGGSWSDSARHLQAFKMRSLIPTYTSDGTGFRLVRNFLPN